MKLRDELKDYEIARAMFGGNTKEHCKIVKRLRKYISVEHCEGWHIIGINENDIGWLVPVEILK